VATERNLATRRRVQAIDGMLRSGKKNSLESMAEALSVTVRTLCRDLRFMKDDLKLPVSHERNRGYFYAQPVPYLDFLEADPEPVRVPEGFRPVREGLREDLEVVHDALCEGKALTLTHPDEEEPFPFHPYFLSRFRGEWVLFGYRPCTGALANLPLSSLREIRSGEGRFPPPELGEGRIRQAGGWIRKGSGFRVGLRFHHRNAWARHLLLTEDQEVREEDGEVRVRFTTHCMEDVTRFLRLAGDGVAVEEPSLLRSLLRAHLLHRGPDQRPLPQDSRDPLGPERPRR
jgi:predicted DNA-binding transcriptional regulator YafY